MKRYIYIIISLLVLASCTNRIETTIAPGADCIILNACLESQNQYHNIFFSYKKDGNVVFPQAAKLQISINGKNKIQLKQSTNLYVETAYEELPFYAFYRFKYDFKPGDELELFAENGSSKAYAKVKFPDSPNTSMRIGQKSNLDIYGKTIIVDFTDDLSSSDLYRLRAQEKWTILYNENGEQKSEDGSKDLEITTDSPLISSIAANDTNILSSLSDLLIPHNGSAVFSDEMITAPEVEIEFDVRIFPNYRLPTSDKCTATNRHILVSLQKIEQSSYQYFRAVNAGGNFGFSGNILVEPTIMPSNVEGGQGFISTATASSVKIEMPDLEFGGIYY